MTTHRWTHDTPRIRADGTRIERDDAFEPTEHEQQCWPERIEEIAEQGTCTVVLESGEREGEPCGRDLPCEYHPGEGGGAPADVQSEG